MLAAERTLAAWWRTALAAQAAGIGLARLLGDDAPALLVRGGASLAVGLSFLVLWMALQRYRQTARRVESEYVERVPRTEMWLGTALLALLAGVAATIVWLPG